MSWTLTTCPATLFGFSTQEANYPDLETVAHVIKHAQARDALAVRGYCTDEETALAVVLFMPATYIFAAEGLNTTPVDNSQEAVALKMSEMTLRFNLLKVQDRWLVSHFSVEKEQ